MITVDQWAWATVVVRVVMAIIALLILAAIADVVRARIVTWLDSLGRR